MPGSSRSPRIRSRSSRGEDALVSPLSKLWRAGHLTQARALGNERVESACALMSRPNPTVIKAVLHAQGRISTPNVRLPLLPAPVPDHALLVAKTCIQERTTPRSNAAPVALVR